MNGQNLPLLSMDTASHLGIGISCFIFTSCLIHTLEKDFGRSLRAMVSNRSESNKSKSD